MFASIIGPACKTKIGAAMNQEPDLSKEKDSYTAGNPVIYQGTFKLSKVGDTFLDMSKWGKGIIFVNGHNLGRYWKVGPQQTLYLPGCWLNKGKNTIEIFEQQNDVKQTEISGVAKPVLDQLNLPKENNS